MKNRFLAMLLFTLVATGCQGNPQVRRVVDSVQAEYRQLEDMVYLLEQDIQVLEQENAKLKRQLDKGGSSSSGTRRSPRAEENPDLQPPPVELPGEMPEIPPSRPAALRPLNRIPEPDVGPVLDAPAKKPATELGKVKPTLHEQAGSGKEPEVTDRVVTHIHLNPLHTCGLDLDHAPGDDGLSILIEPRNAANQFVPAVAPMSVVVLDQSKNGDDARLARWDFSQEQIAEKLVQGDKRGIHLKLPWPAKPPAGAQLELHVRYETPDGKKLQGEKEIFIALPGQFSQRWTPRPADRQRKNAIAAESTEPRVAAAPSPPLAIEPPVDKTPTEQPPPKIVPPAGLSERPPGQKPSRPQWSPTR